jgi:hypothetical protein
LFSEHLIPVTNTCSKQFFCTANRFVLTAGCPDGMALIGHVAKLVKLKGKTIFDWGLVNKMGLLMSKSVAITTTSIMGKKIRNSRQWV